MLKRFGVPFEVLDPAGCIAAEPALAGVRGKFVGGLRLPGDETGDCQLFRRGRARAAARGVRFRYGATVERIRPTATGSRACESEGR